MKRIVFSILLLCLSAASFLLMADDCQLSSSTRESETIVRCSGGNPSQNTSIARSWNLRAWTGCSPNAYYSNSGSADTDTISATASGQCGSAPAEDMGQCPPSMDADPTFAAHSGTQVKAMVNWSSQIYTAGNGTTIPPQCIGNGNGTQTEFMNAEGCNGGFCCGQDAINECTRIGEFNYSNCSCTLSPILVDTAGDGFDLSDAERGVAFDLNGDGTLESVGWTTRNTNDAFLVLDRNANGAIDDGKELFGSATLQDSIPNPNGFNALARFDDNRDLQIDATDAVFDQLRLWLDSNHSGRAEAGELYRLGHFGVVAISLKYHESRRVDAAGNKFRYWAHLRALRPGFTDKTAVDVFLVTAK